MQRKPEDVAAVVNAFVVLLGPPLLMIAGSIVFPNPSSTNTSTVVVGVDPAPMGSALSVFAPMLTALAPFALIAGWRTHVHARRWKEGRATGWQGVGEAAAVAGGIALIVLAPGILTRPLEAPPFLIVYGGAAIVLGLLVGLLLRTTALVTLRRFAVVMLIAAWAAAAVSAQTARPAVAPELLIRPGAAGVIEVGQPVDALYKEFSEGRARVGAIFPEGEFQPVIELRYGINEPAPALVVRIGERPCPTYRVTAILVLDRRYRTANGLGVGSTFGEIRRRYPAARKSWGEGDRVVIVREAGLTFGIEDDDALGDAAVVTSVYVFGDPAVARKKYCPATSGR